MTPQELEALVDIILTSEDAAEIGDVFGRLIDESTAENVPRLYELTNHENACLAEMAACALANAEGLGSMACLLQTSRRCRDAGLDCDGLHSEIINAIEMQPDAALSVLKPLVIQRDYPYRLVAIWAVSYIAREEAAKLLTDIIKDATEDQQVRDEATYYFDGR